VRKQRGKKKQTQNTSPHKPNRPTNQQEQTKKFLMIIQKGLLVFPYLGMV